jgi:hypothetical protein
MRIQSRGYRRDRLYSAVLEQIGTKIQHLADKYDCSKSFVTNTLLAEKLNIKLDEVFYESGKNVRKVKRTA